jgi:4-diphosphocytidyl-2-C-methyl-D-erythritol kinase
MRPAELTIPSFAKINWTLEILGRRPDGYHELRTILQTVSLADTLTFTLADEGIELSCDAPGIPTDENNLVVRAALALREFAGTGRGAQINLVKRIPAAAGLGGGSGNAAITLLALRNLWEVKASGQELIEIGRRLGADVPFFLLGGTGIGVGRGDEVYPLADIMAEHLLLVNAGIAMPTREVYGGLPVELTKPEGEAKMPFSLEVANRSISTPAAMPLLRNDLEAVVYARHPLLGQIRDLLLEAGACGVLMSGSGATIFALFDSEATRSVARRDCTAAGWWCAPVRALSRNDYRLALAGITPF